MPASIFAHMSPENFERTLKHYLQCFHDAAHSDDVHHYREQICFLIEQSSSDHKLIVAKYPEALRFVRKRTGSPLDMIDTGRERCSDRLGAFLARAMPAL